MQTKSRIGKVNDYALFEGRMSVLYVALGSEGLLKVGRTTNLFARKQQLKHDFRAKGQLLLRFDPTIPVYRPVADEAALVDWCKARGENAPREVEWFTGIDYVEALTQAMQIAKESEANYVASIKRKHPYVNTTNDLEMSEKLLNLKAALQRLPNISEFCLENKIPRRTVMRIKAGGTPTLKNYQLVLEAIEKTQIPVPESAPEKAARKQPTKT